MSAILETVFDDRGPAMIAAQIEANFAQRPVYVLTMIDNKYRLEWAGRRTLGRVCQPDRTLLLAGRPGAWHADQRERSLQVARRRHRLLLAQEAWGAR